MFDQIFERSDALRRQLAGPLREARLAYLRHRAEQGAPRSTLRKLAQYLVVVTERLNLQPCGTVTSTQIVCGRTLFQSLELLRTDSTT